MTLRITERGPGDRTRFSLLDAPDAETATRERVRDAGWHVEKVEVVQP